jgi:hypothetical protein
MIEGIREGERLGLGGLEIGICWLGVERIGEIMRVMNTMN